MDAWTLTTELAAIWRISPCDVLPVWPLAAMFTPEAGFDVYVFASTTDDRERVLAWLTGQRVPWRLTDGGVIMARGDALRGHFTTSGGGADGTTTAIRP